MLALPAILEGGITWLDLSKQAGLQLAATVSQPFFYRVQVLSPYRLGTVPRTRKYNQHNSSLRCAVFIWTREIWQPLSSYDSNDAVTRRTLSIRGVPLSVVDCCDTCGNFQLRGCCYR